MNKQVRVYTVAMESRFLYVANIPSIGVVEELVHKLSGYGPICEFRVLDHEDDVPKRLVRGVDLEMTDVVWVQFESVNSARHAKVRAVQKPFYGKLLRISYAPESESLEDTIQKLSQRRELLERRAARQLGLLTSSSNHSPQHYQPNQHYPKHSATEPSEDFIGPRLPPEMNSTTRLVDPHTSQKGHDEKNQPTCVGAPVVKRRRRI